jgi:hypothetical protein
VRLRLRFASTASGIVGTSAAIAGRLTSRMCACQSVTPISRTRNSGLSGQTSTGTGHSRRHPALVGPRLVRQEVGTKNCRDRRETRRTRFSRRKAFSRRSDILSRLPALSVHASGTGLTRRLTMTCFGSRRRQNSFVRNSSVPRVPMCRHTISSQTYYH